MATYSQFKHVELYKIGHGKNRVPNAPKSSIGEVIFSPSEVMHAKAAVRARGARDTPSRPRDTHSRLFGQAQNSPVVPMITDTIRSNISFGESDMNGGSPAPSPKPNGSVNGSVNGSGGATPVRNGHDNGHFLPPMKRNPVTGAGMPYDPPKRRLHPNCREGNPITGLGYSINRTFSRPSTDSFRITKRTPPGGYSSPLW